MSDRARKLEKKRKKREQKRHQLHKLHRVSPVKQAAHGRLVACCMNSDWEERGQAVAFVLREAGGRYVMASFLIDLWCAGLKDVGGNSDSSLDAFNGVIDRMNDSMDGTIDDVEIDEIAEVVAGGVRFARRNGFKLPKDWQKWCDLVDTDLDFENAELHAFGKDGGLLWVGPMHDLRRRLIGSTVEAFLARPDVHFITEPEGGDEFADAGFDDAWDALADEIDEDHPLARKEVQDAIAQTTEAFIGGVQAWCQEQNEEPSPSLEGFVATYTSRLILAGLHDDERSSPAETVKAILEEMRQQAEEYRGPNQPDHILAVDQFERFLTDTRMMPEAELNDQAGTDGLPASIANRLEAPNDAAASVTKADESPTHSAPSPARAR